MEDLGAGLVGDGADGLGSDISFLSVERTVCSSFPLAGAGGAVAASCCFTGLTAGSGRSAISSPDDVSWKKKNTKCEKKGNLT